MATLHLVSNPDAAASCLAAKADDDAVLLIGDGVFALARLAGTPSVAALRDDAASRGMAAPDEVRLLSQGDFVDWVVAHDRSVTWR